MSVVEDSVEKKFKILEAEAIKDRRRTEKTGGMVLAAISILLASVFLWVLSTELVRLFLVYSLLVIAASVGLFAWAMWLIFMGRNGSKKRTILNRNKIN